MRQPERLPVRLLYVIVGTLLTVLTAIGIVLSLFQSHLSTTPNSTHESRSPVTSPREQVEFESGALAQKQRDEQMKQLGSMEPAFQTLLREEKK